MLFHTMPRTPDASDDQLPLPLLTRWGRRLVPLIGHILREDTDLLTRWRARLTAAFLGAVATVGLLLAIPMISVGVTRGWWMLVAFDSGVLLSTYFILFSHRVDNRSRGVFLTGASFVLGILSVVTRGAGSTVLAWLFMSVFLAAFLLGPRATAGVLAATLLTLGGVAVAIARDWMPWAVGDPRALDEWLLTSLNFAFLIIIFAIANGIIIRLLEGEERARALAEQQLREARHNEALGTLAGGIAHDFNNLLVPVLANVEAVRAMLPSGSEADTALHEAERSANRARELVERILTFGRGMNAARSAIDPVYAAREVVELAQRSAPPNVHLELQATLAPRVRASAAELHQILANLVGNAVHAVGAAGRVEVIVDTSHPRERWVRLRVRDNGMGIDPHTRERLFDPYFSTKGPARGTGLGLPIVQSVVLSLGGTISVESGPLQGTTFTVLLPASDGQATTAATATPSRSAATASLVHENPPPLASPELPSGIRVLLVDDEPSVRRASARLLEFMGCTVTSVASGAEALAALQQGPDSCDVLITDYRMPQMSGADLVTAVRRTIGDVPIVVISGHVEAARAEDQLTGSVSLLAKPFTRAALAQAITTAIDATTAGR